LTRPAQPLMKPPSGHVFRVTRKRRPVWYAKYRLPNGRQLQKMLGPAWTERGRPPAGYFTKRIAEAWLRDTLDAARRGALPGLARTGATFADAAAECYVEEDRDCKPSNLGDYRSVVRARLLPTFGKLPLEEVTSELVEQWRAEMARGARPVSNRTRNKALTILGGVMERARKVYGLQSNPARDVEKLRERYDATSFHFYSPEEVHALARAAADDQDAALFVTAAFTGLRRGELIALRCRDVDFERASIRVAASYANGVLTSPKSGRGRVVPMVPDVARVLARLRQREYGSSEGDLVFPDTAGGYLDGSALRRRFTAAQRRAGLRAIRFHDLRHTFGTLAVRGAESIVELQSWMGHAEVRTTMRYTITPSSTMQPIAWLPRSGRRGLSWIPAFRRSSDGPDPRFGDRRWRGGRVTTDCGLFAASTRSSWSIRRDARVHAKEKRASAPALKRGCRTNPWPPLESPPRPPLTIGPRSGSTRRPRPASRRAARRSRGLNARSGPS
jgi:integrase